MTVSVDTAALLAREAEPLKGVFLTHLHLDHVLGMRAVPASVPMFVGAGDAESRAFTNMFSKGMYNTALDGKGPLRQR